MTIEELENLYPDSCDEEAEYRVFRWITDNYQLISKFVEITNKQPKYDLKHWLKDQQDETLIYFRNDGNDAEIQLNGISIYLKPDGTYILTDTTGG